MFRLHSRSGSGRRQRLWLGLTTAAFLLAAPAPARAATATLVKDINPGAVNSSNSSPHELTNVAGTLLFGARDATRGTELWKAVP